MLSIELNYNDARMILKEALLYEELCHQRTHSKFFARFDPDHTRKRNYYIRELARVRSAINDMAAEMQKEFGKT